MRNKGSLDRTIPSSQYLRIFNAYYPKIEGAVLPKYPGYVITKDRRLFSLRTKGIPKELKHRGGFYSTQIIVYDKFGAPKSLNFDRLYSLLFKKCAEKKK